MQRLEELKAREALNAAAVAEPIHTAPTLGALYYAPPLSPGGRYAAGLAQAVPSDGRAAVGVDSRTSLPSISVLAPGQAIAARAGEAAVAVAAARSASTSARVAPQPAAGWTSPPRQGATIQEVPSEAGPSKFLPAPSAGPSRAVNSIDDSELLEFSGGSRLRIRKDTFTPAWAVPPRVLLVEDDQVSRNIFSKFLQVSGCTIDVAVDGIGAVNRMNLEKYDLVLMVRWLVA